MSVQRDFPQEMYELVKRWQLAHGRFEYEAYGITTVGGTHTYGPPNREQPNRIVLYWKPPLFRTDLIASIDGELTVQEFHTNDGTFRCGPSIEACRRLTPYETGKVPSPTAVLVSTWLWQPRKLLAHLRKLERTNNLRIIEESFAGAECVGFARTDGAGTWETVFRKSDSAWIRSDWMSPDNEGHYKLASSTTDVSEFDFALPFPVVRAWQWDALRDSVHTLRESEHRTRLQLDDEGSADGDNGSG